MIKNRYKLVAILKLKDKCASSAEYAVKIAYQRQVFLFSNTRIIAKLNISFACRLIVRRANIQSNAVLELLFSMLLLLSLFFLDD